MSQAGKCQGIWDAAFSISEKESDASSDSPAAERLLGVSQQDNRLRWGTEEVPLWAYDQLAMDNPWAATGGPIFGPAYLWARKAFKVTVLLWLAIPLLTLAVCSRRGQGFASVKLYWFIPALLVIVYLLWCEHRVRRYTLIWHSLTVAKEYGGFRLFNFVLSFRTWCSLTTFLSVLAHADIVTNGMFLGKAIVSDVSSEFGFGGIPFSVFALLGWLSLGVQVFYGYAFGVPRRAYGAYDPNGADGATRPYRWGLWRTMSDGLMFKTLGDRGLNVAQIMFTMAEVCRMTSVSDQTLTAHKLGFREKPLSFAQTVPGEMKRTVCKFMFFGILESGYQLNLQSAGLALAKAASDDHQVDQQTLLSIIISVLVAAKTLNEAANQVHTYRREMFEYDPRQAHKTSDRHRLEAGRPLVLCYYRLFLVAAGLFVLLVCRAIFQTYMCVAVCKYGLHNIGEGCVDVAAMTKMS